MPLSRHSVGTYRETSSGNVQPHSSQLAEPLWTDPGIKSESSLRELISTFKKRALLASEEKATTTTTTTPPPNHRESDHRLSQPGVAKPRVAFTLQRAACLFRALLGLHSAACSARLGSTRRCARLGSAQLGLHSAVCSAQLGGSARLNSAQLDVRERH